jgi:hypothetical protein
MSEPATTLPASDKANCNLQDDRLLYPSFDAFMVAIQDPGKEKVSKSKKNNKEAGVMTYPRIKKICIDIYKKILLRHKDRLPALDTNDNRGAQKLEKVFLRKRKKRGATEVNEAYSKFALMEDDSIYTITNDPKLYGLDLACLGNF